MTISNKFFIGLTVMLSLFSCNTENKNVQKPFQQVMDFEKFITQLESGLVKRVVSLDKVETISTPNPDWNMELRPFLEADINKPAYATKYTVKESYSELTGWKELTYLSTDPSLPVQWATYRFDDSICIAAAFNVQKLTSGYDMEERLILIPDYGYAIDNSQTLRFVKNEDFYLSGQFQNKPQPWRLFFNNGNENVPINCAIAIQTESPSITILNGKEKITAPLVLTDSGYIAEMPVFQSYIHIQFTGDSLNGNFHNLDGGIDNILPITGHVLPIENIFGANPLMEYPPIDGKWEVYFEKDGHRTLAIGIFNRLGDDLFGTFATESGDYRYLQGKIIDNDFTLSTFDGSHLYLFTGTINGQQITGSFSSGKSYRTTWTATRNDKFELSHPDSLTSLNNQPFTFSFPNLRGEIVSMEDSAFKNRPMIVQIMGSWCPNCMDESVYFKELFAKYHPHDLEIIALAFERSPDFEMAQKSASKAVRDLGIPYPVLIAGTPQNISTVLPMIATIKSYPTTLFLNRNHEVVRIHTGFYGPGTGKYFEDYKKETERLISELLK